MEGPGLRTRIVPIGNSKGIRIPKPLLEQSGVGEEVEVYVVDQQIVIRRAGRARDGWSKQFEAMAEAGDDRLLDADAPALSEWDHEEWEW